MIRKMKHVGTTREKHFKIIPEANKVIGEGLYDTSILADMRRDSVSPKNALIAMAASVFVNDDKEVNEEIISATAYCDGRDEFDDERGMSVASAKIEKKRHMKMAKKYDKIYRALCETLPIVQAYCQKHMDKVQSIDEDLVRYYGREEI